MRTLQPSLVNFWGCWQLRNECCLSKHEKQSLFSGTTLARSAGVFFRNTRHRHTGCLSLQTTQLIWDFWVDGMVAIVFLVEVVVVVVVAANTLELVLVFVTFPVVVSSTFGFPEAAFILS